MDATVASRCRYAGFVVGADGFDASRFCISPAEAAAMDPQQRLLLEYGYESLHSACLNRASLNGSLTGVFLGIAGSEFAYLLGAMPAGRSVYAATGSSCSIACGRVSYVLGLHGLWVRFRVRARVRPLYKAPPPLPDPPHCLMRHDHTSPSEEPPPSHLPQVPARHMTPHAPPRSQLIMPA